LAKIVPPDIIPEWAEEIRTIKPLAAGRQRKAAVPPQIKPHTFQSLPQPAVHASRPHVAAVPLTVLSHTPRLQQALAPGHSPQLLKDLGKGKPAFTELLDLHGFTAAEGWQHLHVWLTDARRHDHRCVLVITGKGRGPENMGVLKDSMKEWLGHHPAVIAYHTALPRDGGQGAVYVLLRRT
jgi:DNA-nicking Smr family endonuclease